MLAWSDPKGTQQYRSLTRSQHKEAKEDHRLAMDLIKFSHDELKEEMATGFKTLGDKACLCVDARRQVDGHEERISYLERKVA